MANYSLFTEIGPHFAQALKFVDQYVNPGARQRDKLCSFDPELYLQVWKQGWLVPNLREHHGHPRMDLRETIDLFRGFAHGPLGFCTTVLVNVLGSTPIEKFGSPQVIGRVVKDLQERPIFFSLGMTEKKFGFDVASNETSYETSDLTCSLNGEKNYISNSPVASHFSIFARKLVQGQIEKTHSCFYVSALQKGLSIGEPLVKLGHREAPTATVKFDNLKVPIGHRLGTEGEGFKVLKTALSRSKTLISAMAVGQAERAILVARNHLEARTVKGESLFKRPVLRSEFAHLSTELEAAWGLVCRAANAWDLGMDSHHHANQAKLFCARFAEKAVSASMELVGGSSYLEDHELSRIYRDVKLLGIYEGTRQVLEAQISQSLSEAESSSGRSDGEKRRAA